MPKQLKSFGRSVLAVPLAAIVSLAANMVGCREQPRVSQRPMVDAAAILDGNADGSMTSCADPAAPIDMDLMLVVGSSEQSRDVQNVLFAGLHSFFAELECKLGAPPNWHIGIISSDLGASGFNIPRCGNENSPGILRSEAKVPGCTSAQDSYIVDIADGQDGERITNYEGERADAIECIGRLGHEGCSFEQPLAAAVLATEANINPGFIRDGALLVVLIATGIDDCSAATPSLFDPAATQTLGPLSPFRCFSQGVVCDPDNPSAAGVKNDCQPRNTVNALSQVSVLTETLRSHKPVDKLLIATLGGDHDNVMVSAESGQASLETSCSAPTFAAPPIRLAAASEVIGVVCRDATVPLNPLSAIATAIATAIANRQSLR